MRVEQYITELLYHHNCVILPDFGGFLANTTHAQFEKESNLLLPPSKSISFNEHLSSNDGLLVNHIAKAKKLEYNEALTKVQLTIKEWKQKLNAGEKLRLVNLGVLQMSQDKALVFTPKNDTNYLASSFGLSTVAAIPIKRESLKKEVVQLEASVPLKITPEKRKESTLRPWMKYAAILLLMVSMGTSGYLGYKEYGQNKIALEQKAAVQVTNQLQQATFFDTSPLELPPLHLKVKRVTQGPKYFIIAGAFRSKANADKKVQMLQEAGFDASYIGTNSFGLHQVSFESSNDKSLALNKLREIRKNIASDAWILIKK
ncbi:SPOR domain-containing protein [Croceivirga thetidis]|uniref:SPOR domain-containing protein n=1 Tax=Croceivirga thetidis TaxID=2721623 RepID=A0ABX1GPZ3_9FLAO|nr:SPOR domain-containing protein [Croceivirga thetidis]NKI31150.1 SPOR domain-containing protein [Croceivirga thetidis]